MKRVIVIGGGLAGSEAALQLAKRGIRVILYEMRPQVMTPAHKTGKLAELVCSNSLKSMDLINAHGLLKEELKLLGSFLLECAYRSQIPGGKALVVDREVFSNLVTKLIEENPNIEVIREEVKEIPLDEVVIIATGPLTSEDFANNLKSITGEEYFYFYDAISPIVSAESLDFSVMFKGDRHGGDEESYLNIPLNKDEYYRFVEELLKGEAYQPHFDEKIPYFEGCLPIEEMVRRGVETLRYGPMKPTSLRDPRTGKIPYAVVQLRPENRDKTMYSLVGFQTQLKVEEQKRIFRMLPGMQNAEFLRYGAVHKNTFICSPKLLKSTLQLRNYPNIFIAGQLSGTEGYTEAIMGGLVASINAFRLIMGMEPLSPPIHTMTGALIDYITSAPYKYFQPMNANFGLIPNVPKTLKGLKRRIWISQRALEEMRKWIEINSLRTF